LVHQTSHLARLLRLTASWHPDRRCRVGSGISPAVRGSVSPPFTDRWGPGGPDHRSAPAASASRASTTPPAHERPPRPRAAHDVS